MASCALSLPSYLDKQDGVCRRARAPHAADDLHEHTPQSAHEHGEYRELNRRRVRRAALAPNVRSGRLTERAEHGRCGRFAQRPQPNERGLCERAQRCARVSRGEYREHSADALGERVAILRSHARHGRSLPSLTRRARTRTPPRSISRAKTSAGGRSSPRRARVRRTCHWPTCRARAALASASRDCAAPRRTRAK